MLTMIEHFAGIGGWSEAAKMAGGIKVIGRTEINPFKNKVYDLRHPDIQNYGDIQTASAQYADIFTVSFPCTGISSAGLGKGLEDEHSGLWFAAESLIRKSLPKYVIIENGPLLTIRGLNRILGALAALGYDAEWTHLSGFQFGVQQRRKRLYLIAYTSKSRFQGFSGKGSIFRKLETRGRVHPLPIYPGWARRRDIPEPRTYRSSNDIPDLVHRLECTGDAIIPIIGMYILECIKIHYSND